MTSFWQDHEKGHDDDEDYEDYAYENGGDDEWEYYDEMYVTPAEEKEEEEKELEASRAAPMYTTHRKHKAKP